MQNISGQPEVSADTQQNISGQQGVSAYTRNISWQPESSADTLNISGQQGVSVDTLHLLDSPYFLPADTSERENRFRLPMTEQATDDVSNLNVYPCFLPGEDCIRTIKTWIDNAENSIIVQAYRFTSKTIGEVLINSVKRGVTVKIFIDKGAPLHKNSYLRNLEGRGIEIQVDNLCGNAHNKVIIIDEDHVITGSYNFIDEEDYCDSDTVVFIKDSCVNKKFRKYYDFINSENQSFGKPKFDFENAAEVDQRSPPIRHYQSPPPQH